MITFPIDDQYKESFEHEWQARRAAKPGQTVYRRDDGRYCLAHEMRHKRRYDRQWFKKRAGALVDRYFGGPEFTRRD